MKGPHDLALALTILLAFVPSSAHATETTRSALQTQATSSIATNGAGQISATTLNSLLANIIDSAAIQQSANAWTAQNIFNAELQAKRLNLTDRGTCTMTAGACDAQALASIYTSAPTCLLTWTGTGTLAGVLKVTSTTTSATPASSDAGDTAQVNWACFGN